MRTAIILAGGGDAPSTLLPEAELVIAADSGLALARPLGLDVDIVVGDMDSVDPEALAAAESAGATIEHHPTDKDATDLELALDAAVSYLPDKVVVVGGSGGRLDHLLANAALLASERYAAIPIEWRAGRDAVAVVRDRLVINGEPGDTVTLLAAAGDAMVTTDGLRWQLDHEQLRAGTTRGVSNELLGNSAQVTAHDGVVLVITRRDR